MSRAHRENYPCGACVTCSCGPSPLCDEDGLCAGCGGQCLALAMRSQTGEAPHVGVDVVDVQELARIGAIMGAASRNAPIVTPQVGDRVRIRAGRCGEGDVATVIDRTGFPGSDMRAWRYAISVEFDDGRTNLYTDLDVDDACTGSV